METAPAYPRAASRSWMEINVRPWLAITLLMTVALVAVTVVQWRDAMRQRRLIEQGIAVPDAVVHDINGRRRTAPRDEQLLVQMKYPHPTTGQPLIATGMLSRKPGQSVSLGQKLPLRIDPNDPLVWTDLVEAPPLAREMTVSLMVLLPMVLIGLVVAWLQNARVRKALRTGTRTTGTVVSIKQSPLAPMSRQIGITVETTGARVRHAYWPARNGPVAKGDVIEVIASDAMVLPARSYQ